MDEALQAILSLLVLAVASPYLAWRLGYFQPVYSRETELQGRSVAVFFALFVVCHLLYPAFAIGALHLVVHGEWKLNGAPEEIWLWGEVLSLVLTFITILLVASIHPRQAMQQMWRWGSASFRQNLLFAVITLIVVYPALLLINVAGKEMLEVLVGPVEGEQVAVQEVKSAMERPYLFWVMALAVSTIVPVLEEFIFRGVLLTWFAEVLRPSRAIFLSAVIFSGVHFAGSQGLANLILLPALFSLSYFLGYLYLRQKSLLAPIFAHSLFNAANVALLRISE